ncbi:hypothetical protein FIU87_08935 [Bacillus sp. THAF10]|uniref:DUF3397 domain-containing protein n=1 Tax=Bacillus sp. THAF10 TaxID=2587848 RepID=UPI0012682C53|nr:DUF3397 domain-containing protein [Bacillus sp. THAF10]QFT88768.1 hypothetical protein FIU87_08935 [Bacillus sp. THAF10]
MSELVVGLVATFVTIPIIALFLFYTLAKFITKNNKKAFHLAIDGTTFFFILAVHFLLVIIWNQTMLWVVMIILLFSAFLVVLANYIVKQEIELKRVIKGFWRLNFLMFFVVYSLLSVFGILQRVYHSFV